LDGFVPLEDAGGQDESPGEGVGKDIKVGFIDISFASVWCAKGDWDAEWLGGQMIVVGANHLCFDFREVEVARSSILKGGPTLNPWGMMMELVSMKEIKLWVISAVVYSGQHMLTSLLL
jgi:hypothetical protein